MLVVVERDRVGTMGWLSGGLDGRAAVGLDEPGFELEEGLVAVRYLVLRHGT